MSELPNAADASKPRPWSDLCRATRRRLLEALLFAIGYTIVKRFLPGGHAAVGPAEVLLSLLGYFTAGAILSLFKLRSTKQTLRNRPTN
jgi:hypothetical protein